MQNRKLSDKTLTFWELSRAANGHTKKKCKDLIEELTDLEIVTPKSRPLYLKIDKLIDTIVVGKPRLKKRKGNIVELVTEQKERKNAS